MSRGRLLSKRPEATILLAIGFLSCVMLLPVDLVAATTEHPGLRPGRLVQTVHGDCYQCPSHSVCYNDTKCFECGTCSEGFGAVATSCRLRSDTSCYPCTAGVDYSPTVSSAQCWRCRPAATVQCSAGSYVKLCNSTHDTACASCSEESNNTCEQCLMCTSLDQQAVKPCRNSTGGLCIPPLTTIPTVHTSASTVKESAASATAPSKAHNDKTDLWIGLAAGVLVVLAIILAIILMLRRRSRSGHGNQCVDIPSCVPRQESVSNADGSHHSASPVAQASTQADQASASTQATAYPTRVAEPEEKNSERCILYASQEMQYSVLAFRRDEQNQPRPPATDPNHMRDVRVMRQGAPSQIPTLAVHHEDQPGESDGAVHHQTIHHTVTEAQATQPSDSAHSQLVETSRYDIRMEQEDLSISLPNIATPTTISTQPVCYASQEMNASNVETNGLSRDPAVTAPTQHEPQELDTMAHLPSTRRGFVGAEGAATDAQSELVARGGSNRPRTDSHTSGQSSASSDGDAASPRRYDPLLRDHTTAQKERVDVPSDGKTDHLASPARKGDSRVHFPKGHGTDYLPPERVDVSNKTTAHAVSTYDCSTPSSISLEDDTRVAHPTSSSSTGHCSSNSDSHNGSGSESIGHGTSSRSQHTNGENVPVEKPTEVQCTNTPKPPPAAAPPPPQPAANTPEPKPEPPPAAAPPPQPAAPPPPAAVDTQYTTGMEDVPANSQYNGNYQESDL
ncbi:uncharacterized protein LOC135809406 isoform X2 [Sycon ciliatum]|uniref:uncharacterized protein LOC135809406 isoform X2 n=1 Tax=Sycon ciliatum TaxID=27933 RepID=UPI0031F6A33B